MKISRLVITLVIISSFLLTSCDLERPSMDNPVGSDPSEYTGPTETPRPRTYGYKTGGLVGNVKPVTLSTGDTKYWDASPFYNTNAVLATYYRYGQSEDSSYLNFYMNLSRFGANEFQLTKLPVYSAGIAPDTENENSYWFAYWQWTKQQGELSHFQVSGDQYMIRPSLPIPPGYYEGGVLYDHDKEYPVFVYINKDKKIVKALIYNLKTQEWDEKELPNASGQIIRKVAILSNEKRTALLIQQQTGGIHVYMGDNKLENMTFKALISAAPNDFGADMVEDLVAVSFNVSPEKLAYTEVTWGAGGDTTVYLLQNTKDFGNIGKSQVVLGHDGRNAMVYWLYNRLSPSCPHKPGTPVWNYYVTATLVAKENGLQIQPGHRTAAIIEREWQKCMLTSSTVINPVVDKISYKPVSDFNIARSYGRGNDYIYFRMAYETIKGTGASSLYVADFGIDGMIGALYPLEAGASPDPIIGVR